MQRRKEKGRNEHKEGRYVGHEEETKEGRVEERNEGKMTGRKRRIDGKLE